MQHSVNGHGSRGANHKTHSAQPPSLHGKQVAVTPNMHGYAVPSHSETETPLISSSTRHLIYRRSIETANMTCPGYTTGASNTSYLLNFPKDMRTLDCKKGQPLCSHCFTAANSRQKRTRDLIVSTSTFIQGKTRISRPLRSRAYKASLAESKMDQTLGQLLTTAEGFLERPT